MAQRSRLDSFVMRGIGIALFLCLILAIAHAQRADQSASGAAAVAVGSDDIGGVVTSSNGPEAGVWGVAETRGLPGGYNEIVVPDGRGRQPGPDLPKGTYSGWVGG